MFRWRCKSERTVSLPRRFGLGFGFGSVLECIAVLRANPKASPPAALKGSKCIHTFFFFFFLLLLLLLLFTSPCPSAPYTASWGIPILHPITRYNRRLEAVMAVLRQVPLAVFVLSSLLSELVFVLSGTACVSGAVLIVSALFPPVLTDPSAKHSNRHTNRRWLMESENRCMKARKLVSGLRMKSVLLPRKRPLCIRTPACRWPFFTDSG